MEASAVSNFDPEGKNERSAEAERADPRRCEKDVPEYFLMQSKNRGPIGAIGVHPSREPQPQPAGLVIGYWLGKNYWKQGFMYEALPPVVDTSLPAPTSRF
jgi:RimJ/RimL family protein N-acetyltransferase